MTFTPTGVTLVGPSFIHSSACLSLFLRVCHLDRYFDSPSISYRPIFCCCWTTSQPASSPASKPNERPCRVFPVVHLSSSGFLPVNSWHSILCKPSSNRSLCLPFPITSHEDPFGLLIINVIRVHSPPVCVSGRLLLACQCR